MPRPSSLPRRCHFLNVLLNNPSHITGVTLGRTYAWYYPVKLGKNKMEVRAENWRLWCCSWGAAAKPLMVTLSKEISFGWDESTFSQAELDLEYIPIICSILKERKKFYYYFFRFQTFNAFAFMRLFSPSSRTNEEYIPLLPS